MDVWFERSVPNVKLNLGGTVVTGTRDAGRTPSLRPRVFHETIGTRRGRAKTRESNGVAPVKAPRRVSPGEKRQCRLHVRADVGQPLFSNVMRLDYGRPKPCCPKPVCQSAIDERAESQTRR
jgi:hypothetical protein